MNKYKSIYTTFSVSSQTYPSTFTTIRFLCPVETSWNVHRKGTGTLILNSNSENRLNSTEFFPDG